MLGRDSDNENEQVLLAPESPGALIAEARKSRSLSPADLAARLRLDSATVNAIEQDDFSKLAGPTFVKGYIRSIAKELGIDPEPVINAYLAHTGVDPEPTLADFESRPPPQISSNSALIKGITIGLVALLVVLVISWWRTLERDPGARSGAIESTGVSEAATSPLPYEFSQIVHDDDWRNPPAPEPDAAPVTDAAVDALVAPDEAVANIRLVTKNEAWIEITGANEQQLFYGLAKAGREIEFSGEKPIRFVIGNSPTVELTVDSSVIDLAPYSEQGVAKFTIESGQR